MGNLGKAKAWVEFYDKCDKVETNSNLQHFDLYGIQLQNSVIKSAEKPPENIEFIKDGESQCYMMLAKHKTEIDNYLKIGEQTVEAGAEIQTDQRNPTRIEWSVLKENIDAMDNFWQKKLRAELADQNVEAAFKTGVKPKQKNVVSTTKTGDTTPVANPCITSKIDTVWVVEQIVSDVDLLWGIQTNIGIGSFPYYIDVVTSARSTKKDGLSNFILINLNKKDIDICCIDSKIFIADWYTTVKYDQNKNMDVAADQSSSNFVEGPTLIETGLKYSSADSALLSLGILPCCGKLVIFSGSDYYVYSRYGTPEKNTGVKAEKNTLVPPDFIPFVLKTDSVNVFVSNCKGNVCISAMEFANAGRGTPQIYGATDPRSTIRDKPYGIFKTKQSDTSEIINSTKYYLFKGKGGNLVSGASCNTWDGSPIDPDVAKYTTQQGNINIKWEPSIVWQPTDKVMQINMSPTALTTEAIKARAEETNAVASSVGRGLTGILRLASQNIRSISDLYLDPKISLLSGTPFINRLRGYYSGTTTLPTTKLLLKSYDIISLSHKYDSQDVYSASQSVDVTLYFGKDLRDPTKIDIANKSYGVKFYLIWEEFGDGPAVVNNPFFTGVSLDVSLSEIAGKETITIHCEDYMRILADQYLLNSPFYDGQDWFDAVRDIAKHAGILSVKDETTATERYFLPSGYSFQEPRFRFSPTQTIKDCVMECVKLCEKVVYFNNNGELCCGELQGGLYFSGAKIPNIPEDFEFYRDPDNYDENIILDEKKSEKLIGSTVNQILVTSVDRNSGQPLQVKHSADRETTWNSTYEPITNGVVPPYSKILFYEQNAFGNLESAQNWVAMMAERVYKVASRISFKTATSSIIPPLQFIKVDGLKYRTTSYTRNYNAEDNSIVANVSAEWLGDNSEQ